MTDVERVARIIARASLVRRAAFRGVDATATEMALIVIECGADFLWPEHAETANEIIAALAGEGGE
jgi:hypothetical protein